MQYDHSLHKIAPTLSYFVVYFKLPGTNTSYVLKAIASTKLVALSVLFLSSASCRVKTLSSHNTSPRRFRRFATLIRLGNGGIIHFAIINSLEEVFFRLEFVPSETRVRTQG